MPLTINPSMTTPQPGPPVVKKPYKMRPNGSSMARSYASSEISNLLSIDSSVLLEICVPGIGANAILDPPIDFHMYCERVTWIQCCGCGGGQEGE